MYFSTPAPVYMPDGSASASPVDDVHQRDLAPAAGEAAAEAGQRSGISRLRVRKSA